MRTIFVATALLSALSIVPNGTGAAEKSGGSQETVIVTATASKRLAHELRAATVLDDKALRFQSMHSIGDAVANQLGVTSGDFGASVGRPVIRGLGGARVRVLDDGIGSMDASNISADHGVSLEPIFANRIEIVRGPATLLYGSGASGGLVNIDNGRIRNSMPRQIEGEIYTHYDSASEGKLAAFKLDGTLASHLAGHVDGVVRDTDDLNIPGFARVTPQADDQSGRLPNSATATTSLAGGGSFIGSRGFLGFNVSTYANQYGVPGEEARDDAGNVSGVTIDQEQMRYDLDGALTLDMAALESVTTRWGFSDYEHDEIEPDGALGTRFINDEREGRVELKHRPLGGATGVLGLQYNWRQLDAIGAEAFVPLSQQENVAVFLHEEGRLGPLRADIAVRYEQQSADDLANAVHTEHDLISVSGALGYEYQQDQVIGLSLTRASRGPSAEELFARGPHLATNAFEIGDAALGDEISRNIDVYWRKTAGRIRYDFTLFHNDFVDFIHLRSSDRDGDGLADRVGEDFLDTGIIVGDPAALLLLEQTQNDASFWGFELAGEATLFDDSRGLFDVRLWSDYVDGDLQHGGQIPRLPPLRYGIDLTWERNAIYVRLSAVQSNATDDPAPLDTPTDGHTMINLDTGYTLRIAGVTEVTLFARGTNLADQTARRHTSFVKDLAPLPGISALVGLRARF